MEYDKRDSFLSAGFAVVKQYDPETYARMEDANWFVSTRVTPVAQRMHAAHPSKGSVRENAVGLLTDFGSIAVTISDQTMGTDAVTYVDSDMVELEARHDDVNVTLQLAMTLVHEFRHIHESENATEMTAEPPAYHAGIAFANKLPVPDGPRIAKSTGQVLARIEAAHNV